MVTAVFSAAPNFFFLPLHHASGVAGTPPPFGKPGHLADTRLGHKFGFVGSFHAYIFMLHFMYLVMGVNPCPGTGASGQPAGDTGLFMRFLCVQLGASSAEFFPGLISPRLCLLRLFSFPCLRPFAVCFAGVCSCPGLLGAVSGRRLPFTAEPFRGPGPLFILSKFLLPRLRAKLARSVGGLLFCLLLKMQRRGRACLLHFFRFCPRANLARSVLIISPPLHLSDPPGGWSKAGIFRCSVGTCRRMG